ncbi:response regulator [Rhodopila globiformis]|uniref:Response regulatory domain-containing protein n=1 Tax=Rhodopila globiformis TaxID=1071 RepID=A0A2S6NJ25_RHOGL|nr:response regulator [Rhodopila globiformis]PPQ34738.1 hypothetical protein CCS01_09695 [Rhodopila globiformis]
MADDEIMIALNLEEGLREAGAEVWSAVTVASARECAEGISLIGAVLDVRLGTEDTEEIADILFTRGIPFVFNSGHTLPDRMQARYRGIRALTKPLRQSQIL